MHDEILVYLYTFWDGGSQSQKISNRFATLQILRDGLGQPIWASARKVRRADLTDGAFFSPLKAKPALEE